VCVLLPNTELLQGFGNSLIHKAVNFEGVASAVGKREAFETEHSRSAGALSAEGYNSSRCLPGVDLTLGTLGAGQVGSYAERGGGGHLAPLVD